MATTSVVGLANLRIVRNETPSSDLRQYLLERSAKVIRQFFVGDYGTHYIEQVQLGGRVTSKIRIDACHAKEHKQQDLEAAAKFGVMKGVTSADATVDAKASLSEAQQQAYEAMRFEFHRLGGKPQLVSLSEFKYSDWGISKHNEHRANQSSSERLRSSAARRSEHSRREDQRSGRSSAEQDGRR